MTERSILVVTHTGRDESREAAAEVLAALAAAGVQSVLPAADVLDLDRAGVPLHGALPLQSDEAPDGVAITAVELVIVLGGDGTILRAAELARDGQVPLMGVNLGHVGFLAESERENLDEAVRRALAADYEVEERMTLDVSVIHEGVEVYRTWALNEATVEKASRERMLEVVLEVNGHPLSSFGCDGVVMSTPTGSTAYSFSAGGPVVWPNIEALLCVPLSAHALFARPLVVSPASTIAVEVQRRNAGQGVLWADGRRMHMLEPGARVEARRSPVPIKLARLRRGSFTDRLVNKFNLPVDGWRGPDGTA
mgnify:CR=1 FL=1